MFRLIFRCHIHMKKNNCFNLISIVSINLNQISFIYHAIICIIYSTRNLLFSPPFTIYNTIFCCRNATSETNRNEDTLRCVSKETDALRKQIAQLKRINDNALAENRFVFLLYHTSFHCEISQHC